VVRLHSGVLVRTIGIIPARLASSRLPRKVLLNATGKPLIQHVWEAARNASSLDRLVIAADTPEVADACQHFGAQVVMTSIDHTSGTSRLAEAARSLHLSPTDLVVNVQGDEPEMDAGAIDAAVLALKNAHPSVPMSTIASPFSTDEDPLNPAIVKVVRDQAGRALYFSRSPIPHHRTGGTGEQGLLRHVGLYAYRRPFLDVYQSLTPTPLERTEVLEQLRVLEHGYSIVVAAYACSTQGIDTPEQYQAFVTRHASRRN
jgi:3-deoxy-manno-octulosonate cytidylyltransferase (CMP-KDO synthetase)